MKFCKCGHNLLAHGGLVDTACRMVDQDEDGLWVDCPCEAFDDADSGTKVPSA